jgi:hypothetical protein
MFFALGGVQKQIRTFGVRWALPTLLLVGSIPILQLAPRINGSMRLSDSERNVFAHLGCSPTGFSFMTELFLDKPLVLAKDDRPVSYALNSRTGLF